MKSASALLGLALACHALAAAAAPAGEIVSVAGKGEFRAPAAKDWSPARAKQPLDGGSFVRTLVTDAIVPGGHVYPVWGADHFLRVPEASALLYRLFLWLADVVPARHRTVWIAGFAALQAFAAILFFTWRPVF